MKRFISILFIISLCATAVFAEEEKQPEKTEDGYVYEQNGAGDQSLKISLLANFPLNFNGQLYVGGGAEIGYYRFLSNTFAVGGEAVVAYNVSIGEKPLITVPITFGGMWQPYYRKFEFPITFGIGISSLSCQGMSYFPAFTMKAGVGAFYRINESWSAGITSSAMWIPLWYSDPAKNDNGLYITAGITARYHF